MARPPLTDAERDQRREAILAAAMAVFEGDASTGCAGGLGAVSFRRIATVAGCSYATPYSYFANKAALIDALRARAFVWMERIMRDAIAPFDSADDRLDALATAYVQAALERPNRYALMFFALEDAEASTPSLELKRAKRDALDVCTQVIAAGQASGEFPATVDPLTAAHVFWSAAHGVVSLQVAGQFVMGRDVQTLIPTLIRVLRSGLEHMQPLEKGGEFRKTA
ncbi:MAG: TetR/AcrR family transcriptional regulator [Sinimarinibacterium flocculans]|uniref:TetR/AcrR family transcriptional regulator n=1 Tax=Sinimarinibacterium flocculans TaxID=985250 RepID=UPI002EA54F4E|nr:WHG domain-containing protein [Pseudomonadota bacterium]